MNTNRWSKALFSYFQGLLQKQDRLHLLAPWGEKSVMEVLKWHKVAPLARELYLSSDHDLCPEFRPRFHNERINQLLKDETALSQLKEIERAFRTASIEFMVLKGAFWASQIYPSTLWRHTGDIDLLVRPASRDAALSTLMQIGYRPDLVGNSLEEDLTRRGEVMLIHQSDNRNTLRTSVELHWHPISAPRFIKWLKVDGEDFFQGAKYAPFRGLSLLLPGPEIRFGFQVVHGICQHQLKRFLPMVDLAHMLKEYPDFDFDLLTGLMSKWKAIIPFYLSLKILRLFGFRDGPQAQLLGRLEKTVPWSARILAPAISPARILLSYSGKGYYLRKAMRLVSSKPLGIEI